MPNLIPDSLEKTSVNQSTGGYRRGHGYEIVLPAVNVCQPLDITEKSELRNWNKVNLKTFSETH